MAFILFEETTYFHLCALCACGRDGSRAYFAHTILTRTTRVFLIFVTSAQLINREILSSSIDDSLLAWMGHGWDGTRIRTLVNLLYLGMRDNDWNYVNFETLETHCN